MWILSTFFKWDKKFKCHFISFRKSFFFHLIIRFNRLVRFADVNFFCSWSSHMLPIITSFLLLYLNICCVCAIIKHYIIIFFRIRKLCKKCYKNTLFVYKTLFRVPDSEGKKSQSGALHLLTVFFFFHFKITITH